ncbi:MAG: PIN domain-containing protein [Nitrospirae bacterium]|nr:PIN domain-containing protein [Nitrospirota bacterium]
MRKILLDTGAFVALLDKSEGKHVHCAEFIKTFKGEIYATEPVLTETLYLLGPSIKAEKACLDFILQGGVTLVPQSHESLSRAIALMEKYKDIPMDFADATLVAMAEEAAIDEVFTLDIKGFRAYRIYGRKSFRIWPG